jgi:hypothetical protein
MVESHSDFPFRLLRQDAYLTLEVMLYVEHPMVLDFMFRINKETRSFLQRNYISVNNGFTNEGLITYEFKNILCHYV